MIEFLKRFGKGILYVIVGPFLILFLIAWCLFNIFIFFGEFFKGIRSFFKGKKFLAEFPEEIEAKRILSLEPYNNNDDSIAPINVATMDSNEDKPQP